MFLRAEHLASTLWLRFVMNEMVFGLWVLVFERTAMVEWQSNPNYCQRPKTKDKHDRKNQSISDVQNCRFLMEVFMKHFKKIVITSIAVLFFLAVVTVTTNAQTGKEKTESTTRWQWSDDGLKLRVEIRGKAEFTEDYTDIKDVSEGGSVRIEEDRNGQSRRFEIRRDASGQLQRIYYLNGEARPLDESARTWLAKIVLQAVRQGAIDADKRVQTILRQRGVSGVLDEIKLISGDYAKRRYFDALIKNGNLNAAQLQNVLQEATRQISSDYEQAQLLIEAA